MRVIAAIVTGIGISGLGEWMHRRCGQVLAATLHGTGLAIVLASFFASYLAFNPDERVLSVGAVFAGVALTAALGVVLSLHIESLILAVIALIGAYLARFVLNTGQDKSAELLAYLGILSGVAWVVVYARPRWWAIRTLASCATFLSFFAWWAGLGQRHHHETLATVWLWIYYLGFLVEMVLTTRRSAPDDRPQLHAATAVLSLLNTAAAMAMMFFIHPYPEHGVQLGVAAVVFAGVQAAAMLATLRGGRWRSVRCCSRRRS